jgi:hypothetical protein
VSDDATSAAAMPARHGWDASQPLALCTLVDPVAEGAQQPSVTVWLDRKVASPVAEHVLSHLRLGRSAAYRGGWLRLRNARLVRGEAGGGGMADAAAALREVALVIEPNTSLMRVPDFHASVPSSAVAEPAATRDATASGARGGTAAPPANRAASAPAPPSRASGLRLLPPGVPKEAEVRGAHGAVCTRAASDLQPDQLHRHQQPAAYDPRGASRPSARSVLARSTQLTLPTVTVESMRVLSLREALDSHGHAPCLLRVRARVLSAFPTDPRLWTYNRSAGGGEREAWSYRVVLQLADEREESVFLGAALLDDEASAFFHCLPPADLHKSNATLASLRKRVDALCASGATEFCLWACRPLAGETSERGVAFHIVATQCLVLS